MLGKQKVIDVFVGLLRCYRDDFDQPWYYGVKLPECNPHSLASADVLDSSSLETVLEVLNIAYKHGSSIRIRYDLKH